MADKRTAVLTMVVKTHGYALDSINALLFKNAGMILTKMEFPCPELGSTVISVVVEAANNKVGALSGQLGQLRDVNLKSITI
ncbi:MAG: CopG family transcriptional regulator [Alphaproteobacteria bacterium]|nr:CopG family transcriptional regulator [Alphaproteobacteria bacterium]